MSNMIMTWSLATPIGLSIPFSKAVNDAVDVSLLPSYFKSPNPGNPAQDAMGQVFWGSASAPNPGVGVPSTAIAGWWMIPNDADAFKTHVIDTLPPGITWYRSDEGWDNESVLADANLVRWEIPLEGL